MPGITGPSDGSVISPELSGGNELVCGGELVGLMTGRFVWAIAAVAARKRSATIIREVCFIFVIRL